jgi:hypothetical protein
MQKVKYRCKGCGWTKEMPGEWADVKPRFCPTPTCELSVKKSKGRKSFRNNPEMLETTFRDVHHAPRKDVTVTSVEYDGPEVKEEAHGKEGRRRARTAET